MKNSPKQFGSIRVNLKKKNYLINTYINIYQILSSATFANESSFKKSIHLLYTTMFNRVGGNLEDDDFHSLTSGLFEKVRAVLSVKRDYLTKTQVLI